jgi:hypothetical protein
MYSADTLNLLSIPSGYLLEPTHHTIWCDMSETYDLHICCHGNFKYRNTYHYCCNIQAYEVPVLTL